MFQFFLSATPIWKQRQISDGHQRPLANRHIIYVVIASQWHRSLCSGTFRMIIEYLGCVCRVNALPILLEIEGRHSNGRQNWSCRRTFILIPRFTMLVTEYSRTTIYTRFTFCKLTRFTELDSTLYNACYRVFHDHSLNNVCMLVITMDVVI